MGLHLIFLTLTLESKNITSRVHGSCLSIIFFSVKNKLSVAPLLSPLLWINSKSISHAVWRRRFMILAAQRWAHPFWNLCNPVITSNSRDYLSMNGARGFEFAWLWFFYCLILILWFLYWNTVTILFFVKVPIFLLGTKVRKAQKVFLLPIPQVRHSKIW